MKIEWPEAVIEAMGRVFCASPLNSDDKEHFATALSAAFDEMERLGVVSIIIHADEVKIIIRLPKDSTNG